MGTIRALFWYVRDPVLVQAPPKKVVERAIEPWTWAMVSRVVGWIGAVLAAAALVDYALAFYPLGFGSAEWEIATIGSVVQGLPLISIGLVGLWLCGAGLGRRWLLMVVGLVFLAAAVCVFGLLIVFTTDIPIAVRSTQDVARLGIYKLVAKTLFLGLLFIAFYIVAGVLALRQARGRTSGEAVA